jgi:PAS domain-containing protein
MSWSIGAPPEHFGVSREEMIGKTIYDVFPRESADLIATHDEQLLQSGGSMFFDEYRCRRAAWACGS